MLPERLRPQGFDSAEREEWEQYRERLGLPDDEAVLQFYRQVVYDHFSHFNDHYPDFELGHYAITMLELSAQEASDSIRYFRNDVVDWWAFQYDEFASENKDYIIFQTMSKSGTFPFPPILLDPKLIKGEHWRECGRPLHLIEGTHRVSYLRHMLEKGLVTAKSMHRFVLLRPIE